MRAISPTQSMKKNRFSRDSDAYLSREYDSDAYSINSGIATPSSVSSKTKRGERSRTPTSERRRQRGLASYSVNLSSISGEGNISSPNSMILNPLENQFLFDKTGRVRVAVRCRPPFDDEATNGVLHPVVNVINNGAVEKVSVEVDRKGKRREFLFDVCLPPETTQDETYSRVAKPIVEDVLKGFNGTVMAYGQTGTGKTHTMGILDRLKTQPSGIIPTSIKHIFSHMAANAETEWSVSMSFLQIYLETIQDLLVPPSEERSEENLAIREDPKRGMYVDGLQEYVVRNYSEAVELLNWGLENRVMASTLMNITSSRSHTVLTVYIQQRGAGGAEGASTNNLSHRTLRSKLILVDLAGSERVRKTTSKGARLSEARAINSSLSALGNVIAALASSKTTHVPYRDSKLTRLLTDSLGGRASTVLIATVGPAANNQSETLSTLLFASRCMHVRSTPIVNEELDYASLCAQLQTKLADIERECLHREAELSERYENKLADLSQNLQNMKMQVAKGVMDNMASVSDPSLSLKGLPSDNSQTAMLRLAYAKLCEIYSYSAYPIKDNMMRETNSQKEMEEMIEKEKKNMEEDGDGSTLSMSITEAFERVNRLYSSNNVVLQEGKLGNSLAVGPGGFALPAIATPECDHPPIEGFRDELEFSSYVDKITKSIFSNSDFLNDLLVLKDKHYNIIKVEQAKQTIEKKTREEELVNWSYVLKYLLSTNSKLRQDLRREQAAYLAAEGTVPKSNYNVPKEEEEEVEDEVELKNKFLLATIQYRERNRKEEEGERNRKENSGSFPSSTNGSSIARWNINDVMIQEANAKTEKDVENDAAMRIQEIYRKRFSDVNKKNDLATISVSNIVSRPPSIPTPPLTSNKTKMNIEDKTIEKEEEVEDEEEEVIEYIDSHKMLSDGPHYKVHWKGTSSSEDEWFSRSDLLEDYKDVLLSYEERRLGRETERGEGNYYIYKSCIPDFLLMRNANSKYHWDPKWCALESGYLCVYNVTSMKGTFAFNNVNFNQFDKGDGSNTFPFSVSNNSEIINLSTSNEEERKAWITAIQQAAKLGIKRGSREGESNENNELNIKLFQSPTAMQGFIYKQERNRGGNQWIRMLCRLSLDSQHLSFFETSRLQEIDINKCMVESTVLNLSDIFILPDTNLAWMQNQCKYTFSIRTLKGGLFDFGCDSTAKRGVWTMTLEEELSRPWKNIRK